MNRICLTLFLLAVMARHLTFAMDNRKGLLKRISTLEDKVEELTRRLDEIPEQPAESVAFSAHSPRHTRPSENKVIIFENVPLNGGNHYNPHTGLFTAPFDGLYLFSANICNLHGKHIAYAIICNEVELTVSSQWDDTRSCGSVDALAEVKAGDKISVQSTRCQPVCEIFENVYRWNSFAGVLLKKK